MGIDPWGTAGLTSWDLLREQIQKEGQVTHKVPGFVNPVNTRSGEGGVSTVGMRKDTERREWGVSMCLCPESVQGSQPSAVNTIILPSCCETDLDGMTISALSLAWKRGTRDGWISIPGCAQELRLQQSSVRRRCLGSGVGLVNHTLSSSHRTGPSEKQKNISRGSPE